MDLPRVTLEATIAFDVGTRESTVSCRCGKSHVCSGPVIGEAIGRARATETEVANLRGQIETLARYDIRAIALEVRGYGEREIRGLVYSLVANGYGAQQIALLTLAPVEDVEQLVADVDREIFAAADAFQRDLEMPRLHRERADLYRRMLELQTRIEYLGRER